MILHKFRTLIHESWTSVRRNKWKSWFLMRFHFCLHIQDRSLPLLDLFFSAPNAKRIGKMVQRFQQIHKKIFHSNTCAYSMRSTKCVCHFFWIGCSFCSKEGYFLHKKSKFFWNSVYLRATEFILIYLHNIQMCSSFERYEMTYNFFYCMGHTYEHQQMKYTCALNSTYIQTILSTNIFSPAPIFAVHFLSINIFFSVSFVVEFRIDHIFTLPIWPCAHISRETTLRILAICIQPLAGIESTFIMHQNKQKNNNERCESKIHNQWK